jgi:RNA polymerase sigma factor for flagellar operon FliA
MNTQTSPTTVRLSTPATGIRPASHPPRNLEDRNRLIDSHMYLVHAAAGRMKKSFGRYLTIDELVGYGTEGLIEAADRFDPDRGASFATFSFYRIRGAMLDGLRRAGWYSRYDIARFHAARLRAEQGVNELLEARSSDTGHQAKPTNADEVLRSIEDTLSQIATVHITSLDFLHALADDDRGVCHEALYLTDNSTRAPDEEIDLRGIRDRVSRALATLPERERRLIELHYFADQDLQDAGATMGLSKWSTSRLHSRAVRLLRDALASIEDPR